MENKIENHVTSLDLSRRLAGLGVKKESHFYWLNPFKNQGFQLTTERDWDLNGHHEYYPAYLASELAEMLPDIIEYQNEESGYYLTIDKGRDGFMTQYLDLEGESHPKLEGLQRRDTLANSLGLMLAHLLETGAVGLQDN